tara:strand:- start:521 stop:703 length:183 start_codon:yes stop_codon:yes gene_type:complete
MARERKPKWNPKYNKHWVRAALQDVLIKQEHEGLGAASRKLINDVLAICDKKALEKEKES